MSTRPKRTIKPIERYTPEEQVFDDDFSEDSIDPADAKKRLRGEFDGLDDEEEDLEDGEDEYDVEDGFAVPDDHVESDVPVEDEEEEEPTGDEDEEEEDEVIVYEDDEPDVVEPEAVLEDQTAAYIQEEEGGAMSEDE